MVNKMIRPKKEWRCSWCKATTIKWAGICSKCKKAGTVEEVILIPAKPKATPSQKALNNRAKRSERKIARSMQDIDGADPDWKGVASSTGRIGHITGMRVDGVSMSYFTENKNRILAKWIVDAWLLINQRAKEYKKFPLLHLDPPNMPKDYLLDGQKYKLSTMAVIPKDHHDYLIAQNRLVREARNILADPDDKADKLALLRDLLGPDGI